MPSPKAYQFETCKFQYVQTGQFDVTLNRVYAFDARRINRHLPGPHCTQNSSSMYEYYVYACRGTIMLLLYSVRCVLALLLS